MNGLTIFDFIVIGILAVMTIRGGLKGFVSQVASLVALVAGWIVAARCASLLAPVIPLEEPWNRYAAMLVLFLAVWIGVWLVRRSIVSALKSLNMKEFDRQLGAMVGFLKGLMVCMILTFFGVSLSEQTRHYVLSSKSGHYIAMAINKTGALIPADVCRRLHEQIEKFRVKVAAEQGSDSEKVFVSSEAAATKNAPGETGDISTSFQKISGFFSGLLNNGKNESTQDAVSDATNQPNELRRLADLTNNAASLYEAIVPQHENIHAGSGVREMTQASRVAVPSTSFAAASNQPVRVEQATAPGDPVALLSEIPYLSTSSSSPATLPNASRVLQEPLQMAQPISTIDYKERPVPQPTTPTQGVASQAAVSVPQYSSTYAQYSNPVAVQSVQQFGSIGAGTPQARAFAPIGSTTVSGAALGAPQVQQQNAVHQGAFDPGAWAKSLGR